MPDENDLFDEEPISAPVEEAGVTAEALSAPDDLSGETGPVDQGSQTQPSDAVPTQTEYAAPEPRQIDPQTLGELRFLGVDPSQIPAHMTPESVVAYGRQRMQEVSQRAAQAERYEAELRYLRNQQAAAQEAPRGQGSPQPAAPEPKPEPVDFRKALADAIEGPTPPSYARALIDGKHIVATAGGRFVVAPGSEHVVAPEELAEVNKYVADLKNHREKSFEAVEAAIEARMETRFAERQAEADKAQYVQQFANQIGLHNIQDEYGNPKPFGQALVRNAAALEKSGLDPQTKLQIAFERTIGQFAQAQAQEQLRQQQYAAWYHQQYGAPPQTQSFNQPQPQQFDRQPTAPQAPAPQPHAPDFLSVASHSANGSPFGSASEEDWQAQSYGDLKARTFGQAARQLAGR